MEIKIEKNVPLSGRANNGKFPFYKMEIGDSFSVGFDDRLSLRSMASSYGRKNGKKFTTRKSDDGIRVWRIA